MTRQFRRLQFIRPETAARTVLADFMMRRRRMIAVHRARPPPWPSNIIGPARHGDLIKAIRVEQQAEPALRPRIGRGFVPSYGPRPADKYAHG